jgi:hypothetical protein
MEGSAVNLLVENIAESVTASTGQFRPISASNYSRKASIIASFGIDREGNVRAMRSEDVSTNHVDDHFVPPLSCWRFLPSVDGALHTTIDTQSATNWNKISRKFQSARNKCKKSKFEASNYSQGLLFLTHET